MVPSSVDVLVGFSPPVRDAGVERLLVADSAGTAGPEPGRAPQPRRSASVVLLRDRPAAGTGIEVYLMHRHERMPFAPSVAVFPGGGVDPVDEESDDPVLACALRETEEETTVRLEASDLVPWARWVTPVHEPRRHDTSFFLARLPEGQEAQDVSGETERAEWTPAADALAARGSGDLALMPPTWSIVLELTGFGDVASALRAGEGRQVETVLPRLVRSDEGWVFAYEVVV